MEDAKQEPTAALSQKAVEDAIDAGDVSWDLLVSLSGMTVSERAGDEGRAFAQRMVIPAEAIFRKQCGGDVALFPPVGAINFNDDGQLNTTVQTDVISFDWSIAWQMTYEIEGLADQAREWWPDEGEVGGRAVLARVSRFFRTAMGNADAVGSRRFHTLRAFALAAWVMQAIQQENFRQPAEKTDPPRQPGPTFQTELENYRVELDSARRRLRADIQRRVQSRYWQGAIVGLAMVALISTVVGLIFWWKGANAAYGIAIPAGGLGALVSLLQRMSSDQLVLDIDASRDLLELFGAVRPLIGAVFGLAITALLAGGLIPAIQIPEGQELAFYAGVGFLAGFNERWAQDMLKSSSDRVAG
jgi:hypothetical protein